MMKIIKESHLDHGLTKAMVEYLLKRFGEREGFFIETISLPDELGELDCGLYGPLMGDEPIREDEVHYSRRGRRDGKSRMVDRSVRKTRLLSVIAGPHDGESCVLYTAYGGPVAPREPFDRSLDEEEKSESEKFWAEHALAE